MFYSDKALFAGLRWLSQPLTTESAFGWQTLLCDQPQEVRDALDPQKFRAAVRRLLKQLDGGVTTSLMYMEASMDAERANYERRIGQLRGALERLELLSRGALDSDTEDK